MAWIFYVSNRSSKIDRSVFKEFYLNYYRNIYSHVHSLIPDHRLAEYLTHQTLVQIYKKGDLHNDDKLFEIAIDIATRICFDHFKKVASDGNSAQAYKASVKNAAQTDNEVETWGNATPEEQIKMFSEHRTSCTPLDKIDPSHHWESFKKQLAASKRPASMYAKVMAAAMLIAVFSTAVFYYTNTSCLPDFSLQEYTKAKGPELILGNETIIKLDNVPDGAFTAGGVQYIKTDTSLICVRSGAKDQAQARDTNILSVPPGRRYQITLSDSSVIMLSASSRLRFPVNFSTNERWVFMEGQAFFDVNASPTKPFIVNVNNQVSAKAFGTAFNIRAYDGAGHIKATLLEGHLVIKAYSSKKSRSLRAGQQVGYKNGQFVTYDKLNIPQVIAWKEDKFNFDSTSVYEVLEEVGRWYNIKIKYNSKIPDIPFTAQLYRSRPLKETIDIMSMMSDQIHVQLKSDTLIVYSQQRPDTPF